MVLQNFVIPGTFAYGTGLLRFVRTWTQNSRNFEPKWVHWHTFYSLTPLLFFLFRVCEVIWEIVKYTPEKNVLIGTVFLYTLQILDVSVAAFCPLYLFLSGKRMHRFLRRLESFPTVQSQPESWKCGIWFSVLLILIIIIGVRWVPNLVKEPSRISPEGVRYIFCIVHWSNTYGWIFVSFCLLVCIGLRLSWIYEDLLKELEMKITMGQFPGVSTRTLVWKVEEIQDLLQIFNSLCGPLIITLLTRSLRLLFHLYYFALFGNYSNKNLIQVCSRILVSLNVLSLLELGHRLNDTISKTKLRLRPLERYFMEPKAKATNWALYDSWSRLMHFKWTAKPCGIFVIDRSTALGIMSTSLTLTVVLLQVR